MKSTDCIQPGYKKASATPSSATHEQQMKIRNHSKSNCGQDSCNKY